jgi:thioredoxin-related protein
VLSFLPLVVLFAQSDEELASLRWHQWDEGKIAAQTSSKFMLVDVFTTWCGWCKKMDRSVYGNQSVQRLLATSFIPIKLNAESSNLITYDNKQCTEQVWAEEFKVNGYPATLVFDQASKLVARLNGYVEPEKFIRFLKFSQGKYYTKYTFQQYLKNIPDDQ